MATNLAQFLIALHRVSDRSPSAQSAGRDQGEAAFRRDSRVAPLATSGFMDFILLVDSIEDSFFLFCSRLYI